MILCLYWISAALLAVTAGFSRHRWQADLCSATFCTTQAALALWIACGRTGCTEAGFFTFDAAGTLFFGLLALVSPFVLYRSIRYLDREALHVYRLYHTWMILLCAALAGVYFADNAAVTWIFLEATTLCTAGLVYHRRSARALEATWKYIFVCSVGIAVAYLGILLLSTGGSLRYADLATAAAGTDGLYLKAAFLFILVGYSCKMELFPLYPIGVDANFAAPAPAAALISTALVNGGFLSIYRILEVLEKTDTYPWAQRVLVAAGILSVLVGAFYMRRTNHYKRLLSYSTVENMGIAAIGLGIGGIGTYAAMLHVAMHTLIKSGLFLQLSRIGKQYGTYRINRIAGYAHRSPVGAGTMLAGTLLLLGFPPSPLFISEVMIFKQLVLQQRWGLLVLLALLLCLVLYTLCGRMLRLCFQPAPAVLPARQNGIGAWLPLVLLAAAAAAALIQPSFLTETILTAVQAG